MHYYNNSIQNYLKKTKIYSSKTFVSQQCTLRTSSTEVGNVPMNVLSTQSNDDIYEDYDNDDILYEIPITPVPRGSEFYV